MAGEGQRFYSEEEAERLLKLAVQKSGSESMSRERVLQMAAELGVSPEAFEAAERQMQSELASERKQKATESLRSEYRKHLRSDAIMGIAHVLWVSIILFGIWYFMLGHDGPLWAYLIGLFLVAKVAKSVGQLFRQTYREESFEAWVRRRKKNELDPPDS